VVIEVQIDGVTDLETIRSKFEANGLKVDEITRTIAKAI
jgi:acuB family protein